MTDKELASEIVALLTDGEPVHEVYGLLRKLKSPALTLELDLQWSEWNLQTHHPTIEDYRHDAQWSCDSRLSDEDNAELSAHIVKVLKAWVRSRTPKSRKQPDSAVTKWVRKHWHKYGHNKTKAVKAYMEIENLSDKLFVSLYAQLNNDSRKTPLVKPKK